MATANSRERFPTVHRIHDDRLDVPNDPDEVFETVIAGNSRVCQECYRLLRHYEDFPWRIGVEHADILAFVEEELPEGSNWNLLDREYFESIRERDRLASAWTDEGKTSYCTGCGTMDPHRSPPPRSVERARDTAAQLSMTLHEFGIGHDWVHLLKRIQDLKQTPDLAGNDFECFRMATAEAIQRVAPE